MAIGVRWKIGGAAALLLGVATCFLPLGLRPRGGGWYTYYSSSLSMDTPNTTSLYRRGLLGTSVLVDDNVSVRRYYPPDCILYERWRDASGLYAACGWRVPVRFTLSSTRRKHGGHAGYEALPDGLRRREMVRVVDGRLVATVERVPIAALRAAAESAPRLFPGWSYRTSETADSLRPVVREEPVDVNARGSGGITPLIDATRVGHLDVVDALLRHGAHVNARDSMGTTALQVAIGAPIPDIAIVRRLLDAGADRDARDAMGSTPLINAAISKNSAVFRVLLEMGADACRRDKAGGTIVDWSAGPYPMLVRMAEEAYARCVALEATRQREVRSEPD